MTPGGRTVLPLEGIFEQWNGTIWRLMGLGCKAWGNHQRKYRRFK
jgi:hypothetical protein